MSSSPSTSTFGQTVYFTSLALIAGYLIFGVGASSVLPSNSFYGLA